MQLLRITSTPMKYQFVTEPARLEYSREPSGYTMTKTGGELTMQAENIKVQMDSTEFRNGLGYLSRDYALQDFVSRSKRAGKEATERSVEFGNQVIHIEKGASIPDILYARLMQDKSAANLTFVPLSPIEMTWNGPSLTRSYEPVRQTFDWRASGTSMEFVPSSFSMNIQQYPEVKIEYLGKPNYVPPSASPDYQGTA